MKLIAIASLLLTLNACTPPPKPIVKYEYPPVVHPELPSGLMLTAPRFYVINQANSVFVATSVKDYEVMAGNFQEVKRYIKQSKAIIIYYRRLLSAEESNPSE